MQDGLLTNLVDDPDERGDETLPILEPDPSAVRYADPPGGRATSWIVAVLAFSVFFPFLGGFGLWDPWETHYGEVTRNMVESHDWVSPRWGYEGRPVGAPPAEKGPFFSKPIFIFWSEATAIRIFGYSEWSFRLPMALLAFLCVIMAFRTIRAVTGDERAGLLAALVVATCPQFYLIARQAQTDMPFVGSMSIGVLFFLMAVFRPHRHISDRRFLAHVFGTLALLGVLIFPQLVIVALDVRPDAVGKGLTGMQRMATLVWKDGRWHAAVFALLSLPVLASVIWPLFSYWSRNGRFDEAFKDSWTRRLHLLVFYACIALATIAKGLLGFLLPGAIIFLFLLITWRWRLLGRVELLRGIGVFCLVGLPWYMAMFSVHGNAFYSRFIVHDHFSRFASGVHQVDTGLFEHFIKWLGLGMFPWSGLIPLVLLPIFRIRGIPKSPRAQLPIFLFLWALFAYFLFTRSSTKFHHYIFPALVPLALLLALWLRDLPRMPRAWIRLAAVVGIGFVISMGWTVHDDKQALRNLMTYKYDRPLPEHLPVDPDDAVADTVKTTWSESRFFEETPAPIRTALVSTWGWHPNVIRGVTAVAVLGFLLWLIRPSGAWLVYGTRALALSAIMLTAWAMNVYMPMLSPAWSQKYIFDEYYARCKLIDNPPDIQSVYTPVLSHIGLGFVSEWLGARPKQVCDEDVIAWLFTWRGETFYSNNEILPVSKAEYMKDYLRDFNKGRPFFAVLEVHRRTSFDSALDRETKNLKKDGVEPFDKIAKWKTELIHAENPYFVLVHAQPERKPPPPPLPEDGGTIGKTAPPPDSRPAQATP